MNRNGLRGPRTASLIVLLLSSALCAQAVPVASAKPGEDGRLTIHNNSKQDLAGLWNYDWARGDAHPIEARTLDFSGGRSIPPGHAMGMPIAYTNLYEFTAQICRNGTWRNLAPIRAVNTDFYVDVNAHDEVYAVYKQYNDPGNMVTSVLTDSHKSC